MMTTVTVKVSPLSSSSLPPAEATHKREWHVLFFLVFFGLALLARTSHQRHARRTREA
jgi:hypothetical protein